MTSDFINKRALTAGRTFGASAARAKQQAARGGGFKKVDGQYNGYYPRKEKATWFAICPDQSWNFDIYDRESGEVVHMENEYYYAYTSHRVQATNRSFQCSAGPHKDKPCWGCGIRNHFYAQKREKEEREGLKIQGEAPINAMVQYAYAGVLLETIAKVQQVDGSGKPKKNRSGEPILKETPTCLLNPVEAKRLKAQGATTFGLPVHYSVGITHLNALTAFDAELQNYCANCAGQLHAALAGCPDCGTEYSITNEDGEPLTGQDLAEVREVPMQCECGFEGGMLPIVQCRTCEHPVEGKLVDFAVRLISEKVGDKQNILKFTDVRPIHTFIEKYPAVAELLKSPLKLDDIFAPTPLQNQTYLIPEHQRGDGVSPAPRAKKGDQPDFEPYTLGGAVNDTTDDD